LLLALSYAAPQIGYVQEQHEGPPVAAASSRFRDPADGQIDVSSFLEKPSGFLPVPVVITEPAVGYGGGLVGMFLRPRKQAGEEGWARPNISALGAIGTENGTRAAFAADASRWLDGRLKTLARGGGGRINLDFYGAGLGLDEAARDQAIRYSLDFNLAFLQGSWQIKPKSPWWLGLRYIYARVEPKLRDEPAIPGLADRVDVEISARPRPSWSSTAATMFSPRRAGSTLSPCSSCRARSSERAWTSSGFSRS
jgi:hypothetical protein